MTHRPQRFGDMSMEHGGGFYAFDGWPYWVSCLQVVPCSEAGGPDNQFWVERGALHVQRSKPEMERILATIGMDDPDEWRRLGRAGQRHAKIQAVLRYCGMGGITREVVQVGPTDTFFNKRGWDPITADITLRAGSSIENYARRKFKESL